MPTLERSIQEAKTLSNEVAARRNAWPKAAKIIDQCFADFDQRWREVGGDTFYIEKRTNHQSPFGLRTINSNCVAMHCGNRPTGIGTLEATTSGQSASQVLETSGKLLFSQMPDGHLVVFATPPTSDVKKAPFEQLILHISIPPSAITYSLVERAIDTYLWLQRVASFEGRPNFYDRVLFFRYWLTEWRHKNNHAAWVIFWVGVVTLIFAAISASADLKSLFWSNS